ncbi:hypothetical protein ABB37_03009 [Leptomonas pyrrhocoris]|uniref:Transmembrane protein n=1 Tax=Leptomonas pyrrhocoris TaxID=157538 RepID=A0A0N0DXY9_LEPPY|nr:hypothetical protein ABB37_03009 [Leptomonas pyrrhocoris]XP_015661801.1 hypothetical protein ABB37_03009 [Leptomonas pyrrhocoris]KPA83361.1 hypothetical protein ABB37_03009 [Leptomonas pyrrhocoris]KPA83362.1 hypothetical protein ABB37_03009 [Leptomonas pyrrhocoris]|eukprot:XP_015661800.1 hypothetical protein ABB37_03009 [Leptomonas pyrrhocoris]
MRRRAGFPTSPVCVNPDANFSAEWREMNAADSGWTRTPQPRTLEEFRAQLCQTGKERAKRSVESEEEEDAFYRTTDGQPRQYEGRRFFEWWCPANPTRARLRVERLYWIAWKQFLYGFFMSGIGTVLMLIGIGCTANVCEEKSRGVGVIIGALLLCIPGYYCLFVLYMYATCQGRYTYLQLPEG